MSPYHDRLSIDPNLPEPHMSALDTIAKLRRAMPGETSLPEWLTWTQTGWRKPDLSGNP